MTAYFFNNMANIYFIITKEKDIRIVSTA